MVLWQKDPNEDVLSIAPLHGKTMFLEGEA
jgi:hypothetical protein